MCGRQNCRLERVHTINNNENETFRFSHGLHNFDLQKHINYHLSLFIFHTTDQSAASRSSANTERTAIDCEAAVDSQFTTVRYGRWGERSESMNHLKFRFNFWFSPATDTQASRFILQPDPSQARSSVLSTRILWWAVQGTISLQHV